MTKLKVELKQQIKESKNKKLIKSLKPKELKFEPIAKRYPESVIDCKKQPSID